MVSKPGIWATVLSTASLGLSIFAVAHAPLSLTFGEWIPGFGPACSLQLDWLSSWLLLLLQVISLAVHIYSLGYMKDEPSQFRYFAGLQFFVAMMTVLILSGSYLMLFAGWEGVGLASYILIGFHYERPLAAKAATKAFIVNRIGDAGLLLAVIGIALTCGTTNFTDVAAQAPHLRHGTVVLFASLLAVGAVGKSAQFPLHVWLPDAMEGPTPVSALIHSATMVCAGVYLLARSNFLFTLAPEVGEGVAVLGILSALLAATVALAENDIKRVLAYSTVSQIGFMFVALGIGAERAAMYHVVTHAFFKSLLFLGAGSVIHALHGEQNLQHMGGLRKRLPITFATMLIATLTLAGVPGLSAFFSKDLILEAGFEHGHAVVTITGLVTSLLTAFYAWRMMALAFYGEPRRHQLAPHEAPAAMRVPLVVLAACCVLVGWLFVPIHWDAWSLMLTSTLAAIAGIWAAWQLYLGKPEIRRTIDTRFAPIANLLRNRWYIDAVYEDHLIGDFFFGAAKIAESTDTRVIDGSVNGAARFSRVLAAFSNWFDRVVVDGAVRVTALLTRYLSWPSRALQTGFVQTYAFIFIAGVLAILGFYLSR